MCRFGFLFFCFLVYFLSQPFSVGSGSVVISTINLKVFPSLFHWSHQGTIWAGVKYLLLVFYKKMGLANIRDFSYRKQHFFPLRYSMEPVGCEMSTGSGMGRAGKRKTRISFIWGKTLLAALSLFDLIPHLIEPRPHQTFNIYLRHLHWTAGSNFSRMKYHSS